MSNNPSPNFHRLNRTSLFDASTIKRNLISTLRAGYLQFYIQLSVHNSTTNPALLNPTILRTILTQLRIDHLHLTILQWHRKGGLIGSYNYHGNGMPFVLFDTRGLEWEEGEFKALRDVDVLWRRFVRQWVELRRGMEREEWKDIYLQMLSVLGEMLEVVVGRMKECFWELT